MVTMDCMGIGASTWANYKRDDSVALFYTKSKVYYTRSETIVLDWLLVTGRRDGLQNRYIHCLEINSFLPGSSTSFCVEITITYQIHGVESLFFLGILQYIFFIQGIHTFMTILSKQQTSYTVKRTKPTEHFFESHYCHVCNEKFKNASFGFAMSICMPVRMSSCDSKNPRIFQWTVTKFYTGNFHWNLA